MNVYFFEIIFNYNIFMKQIYILDTNIILQKKQINKIMSQYEEKPFYKFKLFLKEFKSTLKKQPNVFITPIIMSEVISQINFPIDNYKKNFLNTSEEFLSKEDLNKYIRITSDIVDEYKREINHYVHKDLQNFNSFKLFMEEDASLVGNTVQSIKDLLIAKELIWLSRDFSVVFVSNNKKDFKKFFNGIIVTYEEFLNKNQFKSKEIKFVIFQEFVQNKIKSHFFDWEIKTMDEFMHDDFFFYEKEGKYNFRYEYEQDIECDIWVNSTDVIEYKGEVLDAIKKIIEVKQTFIQGILDSAEDMYR